MSDVIVHVVDTLPNGRPAAMVDFPDGVLVVMLSATATTHQIAGELEEVLRACEHHQHSLAS